MSDTKEVKPHDVNLPWWKKLLFSAILLLIVAVVLELSASFYLKKFRGYDGQHLLQYEFDPYKNILPTRNYVDTRGIKHNAQGFRHAVNVTRKKEPGVLRVFLMGGSTAYGTGGLWPHLQREFEILHDSTTISAYLQRQLAAQFPGRKVEVINAGIPSMWTHHHLIYLNQSILRYDPDVVIFLDGFNDYFFAEPGHDQFARYAYNEHAGVIMGQPTFKALGYANVWWLSRKSAFFHVAFRQAQNLKKLFAGRPERRPMNAQTSFANLQTVFPNNALKMIARTAAILQLEKVHSLFVLQPMLIMEGKRAGAPEMEKRLFQFNVESYLPNYQQFMELAYPYARDQVSSTVSKLGGVFLDSRGMYEGVQAQIFTDYAHLTPLANRLLAERMTRAITPMLSAGAPKLGESPNDSVAVSRQR